MKKVLFILFFILSEVVFAQIISTDRPDQTEGSTTIPKGALQIESGIAVSYSENSNSAIRQWILPNSLFRISLTKGLELRLVHQIDLIKNTYTTKTYSGINDLQLGAKVQLFAPENSNTTIAFLTHLVTPTGSKVLTADSWGTINKFCIAHTITEKFSIGYNLGYDYLGVDAGDLTYAVAFGFAINPKLSIYLEPYGVLALKGKPATNFDAGLTYLLSNTVQLDYSFGVGLDNTMNYMAIGCSILFLKPSN